MLGVSGAPAIAKKNELAASGQSLGGTLREGLDAGQ
jgi:hypothetical protein